jgi:hypothetical protein
MSEDKKVEVLPAVRSDLVARTSSLKSMIWRILGVSENEEYERQARLHRSATDALKAEIEYHTTRGVRDRLPVSMTIDALQELNKLIDEAGRFQERSAERNAKEERARRKKESAGERSARRAKKKIDHEFDELVVSSLRKIRMRERADDFFATLESGAGGKEEELDRIRKLKAVVEQALGNL